MPDSVIEKVKRIPKNYVDAIPTQVPSSTPEVFEQATKVLDPSKARDMVDSAYEWLAGKPFDEKAAKKDAIARSFGNALGLAVGLPIALLGWKKEGLLDTDWWKSHMSGDKGILGTAYDISRSIGAANGPAVLSALISNKGGEYMARQFLDYNPPGKEKTARQPDQGVNPGLQAPTTSMGPGWTGNTNQAISPMAPLVKNKLKHYSGIMAGKTSTNEHSGRMTGIADPFSWENNVYPVGGAAAGALATHDGNWLNTALAGVGGLALGKMLGGPGMDYIGKNFGDFAKNNKWLDKKSLEGLISGVGSLGIGSFLKTNSAKAMDKLAEDVAVRVMQKIAAGGLADLATVENFNKVYNFADKLQNDQVAGPYVKPVVSAWDNAVTLGQYPLVAAKKNLGAGLSNITNYYTGNSRTPGADFRAASAQRQNEIRNAAAANMQGSFLDKGTEYRKLEAARDKADYYSASSAERANAKMQSDIWEQRRLYEHAHGGSFDPKSHVLQLGEAMTNPNYKPAPKPGPMIAPAPRPKLPASGPRLAQR